MRNFPIPFNEDARAAAVEQVPGLTRENEVVFDAICRAAAAQFDCPIAHISVLTEHSQWFKSIVGIELGEIPKESSFCTHTIMSDVPLIIPDLSRDARFAEHPMVAEGGPQARFYAGVPLVLSSGLRFGALCVVDVVSHPVPDAKSMQVLSHLAEAVTAAVERAPAALAEDPPVNPTANFLTLVGHELRTPLTVMQGALGLIGASKADPTTVKLARSAERSTEHLRKLIETILKFSDVYSGDLQLNDMPVCLSDLLSELHEAHSATVGQGGKVFNVPVCEVGGAVLLDADHIRICMTSLLLNSVLHGGDAVTLSARSDPEGHVMICMHDTGSFDSHVELAELYKPFVVGGCLDKRAARGGLGLGLPLTRKLVELHGGEFDVVADTQGTTARIRLPKWRRRDLN